MQYICVIFNGVDDPKRSNATKHNLHGTLMIAFLCFLSGGQNYADMERFGRIKEGFLRGFMSLGHGIPSHDAVTVCHVADLTMLARECPETPATEVCPERDVRLLFTLLEAQGHRGIFDMAAAGAPPDIRTFVIDPGRLVGTLQTKRQPLSGVKKV